MIATSENYHLKVPKFLKQGYGKLELLQRKLQFKKKGSRRWKELQHRIAKLHAHVASKRKDWHYKLAHSLCDQAGIIFAENLNLKAIAGGRFAKDSLDASFGQFIEILAHVCRKRDVDFAKVDPDGTSQI
ncbi:MAG: transposase, partial [Cyanobacteria bacterium QS_8_48_54]